jgi:hypothetical protein
MVGDYISTSVIGDKWISIVPLSEVPDIGGRYRQHMFAAAGELDAATNPQPAPKPACPIDLTDLLKDLLCFLKTRA